MDVPRWMHMGGRAMMCAALVVGFSACAGPEVTLSRVAVVAGPVSLPDWQPGDRWVYEWTAGTDTGTKTAEVVEIRDLNSVLYYVVRIGDVDHYYTRDLQWAGGLRNSKVEARMVPPQPWFTWPLETGRTWVHRGVYEVLNEKTSYHDTFSVTASEMVEVPAGRFTALMVNRETGRGDSDQYWYAPEVRWYVKWIGRRGDIQFEVRLREYRAAPRLVAPVPSPTRPSAPQ